ncbi:MAG: EAL domain-containing protein [Cellvibrionaceae bacterium]
MELHDKFKTLHKSLMNLVHNRGQIDCDKETKLKNILSLAARQLKVSRISLWHLNLDETCIECELLYDHENKRYERDHILYRKDFPRYFEALTESKLIDAHEAQNDSRTNEFNETYLKPLNIFSMLDAPVFSASELYGVICIEQTGAPRNWDISEMSYAAAIADTISLLNEQDSWLKAQEQINFLTQVDGQTGLENRRYFQQHVESEIRKPYEGDGVRALVIYDVDFFKGINDAYGPKNADKVLHKLSNRFVSVITHYDCRLSRLAGDTFGFWFTELESQEHLEQAIKQIQLEASKPISVTNAVEVEISGSIGVLLDREGEIKDDPIRCAEIALHQAKEHKNGGVEYFSEKSLEKLRAAKQLEHEILSAFEEGQFIPHYQPIMASDRGTIAGIEALVRWQHPENGLIPPFKFLPVVAKLGLMSQLGSFMLRQACEDIKDLHNQGIDIQWVSVNLAADQLYNKNLTTEIKSLLEEFKLPTTALELEIVEELINQNSDIVRSQLSALSTLGVELSIDDFGTGYSSLSRLKHLPVTKAEFIY